MNGVTTIFAKGLEFYAYHGVSPEEQIVGHRFRMDISVQVSETAALSDRIEDTVDYGEIASVALTSVTSRKFFTLERAARVAGEELLKAFPSIESAQVRLAKLLPPLPLDVAEVGVEISASR